MAHSSIHPVTPHIGPPRSEYHGSHFTHRPTYSRHASHTPLIAPPSQSTTGSSFLPPCVPAILISRADHLSFSLHGVNVIELSDLPTAALFHAVQDVIATHWHWGTHRSRTHGTVWHVKLHGRPWAAHGHKGYMQVFTSQHSQLH